MHRPGAHTNFVRTSRWSCSWRRSLLFQKAEWGGTDYHDPEVDRKYAQILRENGIDVETLAPDVAAELIQRRSVRPELVAVVDNWAIWGRLFTSGDRGWKRLVEIARLADPDPWRNRLRDLLDKQNHDRTATLTELAAAAERNDLPVQTTLLWANMLRNFGAPDQAIGPLLTARSHHPDDYGINLRLGVCYVDMPTQLDEAVRYFTAAQVLRPDSAVPHNYLGVAFWRKGKRDKAIACYRAAIGLKHRLLDCPH